ncbi:hypothetical protein CIK79_08090 [Brevibacterium aurantiacum]|uniref:Uncharacterized protein n=1 Tax=Brevibacterium aurantiacum TaxID=273384 RepID=A0A2A3X3K8_BREAU|nr:hypothetical protein CIK79_08090 [Brevibacterium aurantiacum]
MVRVKGRVGSDWGVWGGSAVAGRIRECGVAQRLLADDCRSAEDSVQTRFIDWDAMDEQLKSEAPAVAAMRGVPSWI